MHLIPSNGCSTVVSHNVRCAAHRLRSHSTACAFSQTVNLLTHALSSIVRQGFETCLDTAPGPAGTALKLPTRHVSAHGARGAPSSCQDAGLVAVGRQEPQQSASEVSKLLAAVLGKNALSNGLQGNVPSHP